MIIPDNILESLLCNRCKKYLSVSPIKIYPNRHILCGRCSQKNDSGIVSNNFNLLVENFEFPCVNRYQGCDTVLSNKEMKLHEQKCIKIKHECMICNDFNGSVYYLRLHLIQNHQENALSNAEVWIELNDSVDMIYWFCQDNMIFFVDCNYDSHYHKLYLKVINLPGNNHPKITRELTLLNIKNKVQHKSQISNEEGFRMDIDPQKYPNNIVICRLEVNYTVKTQMYQECSYTIDPSATSVTLKCKFDKISELKMGAYRYFEQSFFVGNIQWKVFIQKSKNGVDNLNAFLECQNIEQITNDVFCEIRLLSKYCENTENLDMEAKKTDWITSPAWGTDNLISWESLMDVNNGFLEDDSIRLDFVVKYDPMPINNGSDSAVLGPVCVKCKNNM